MNVLALSDDGTVLYAGTMGARVYRLGNVPDTQVANRNENYPEKFRLDPCAPNPFNPATTISYILPAASNARMEIMSVRGQTVRTLFNRRQSAGHHVVSWDGKDNQGKSVPSGLYLYRLSTPIRWETRKMTLIR